MQLAQLREVPLINHHHRLAPAIPRRMEKEKEKANLRTKCHSRVACIPLIKCLSSNPTKVLDHKLDLYHQCKEHPNQGNGKVRMLKNMELTPLPILIHSSGHAEEPSLEKFTSLPRWNQRPSSLGRLLCPMKPVIAQLNYQMVPMIKTSRCFFLWIILTIKRG